MTGASTGVPLRRTALYEFHRSHGGHLVPFAGWEMPLYYRGILAEHEAVRSAVGLFDVSHMGVMTVVGGHAAELLARRTTANVGKLLPGQVRYTFLLDATGAIVDDLLITRTDDATTPDRSFLVVPNAATAPSIYDLLRAHRLPDTTLVLHNPAVSILAVQGPKARATLEQRFGWSLAGLKYYTGRLFPADAAAARGSTGRLGGRGAVDVSKDRWVSRTGYTGEAGYEIFLPARDAPAVAEELVAAGVVPCGLGARDSLRLEKGFLLSGQDFHHDRTPIEAGQERFVELDHPFVGRAALEQQVKEGPKLRLVGISTDAEGAIPRSGTPLKVGEFGTQLSSGALSLSLHHGIGLAYLPPALGAPGTEGTLEIRGRSVPAKVVPTPFYPAPSSRT